MNGATPPPAAHHLPGGLFRSDAPDRGVDPSRTLVVIPARNEAGTIGKIVREIRNMRFDVLVVDDASTDGTADTARSAGATVLSLTSNLGAWGAMQTGMRFARRAGHLHVVTIDADGQHPCASIPDLLQPIVEDRADVVIGSCTVRGSKARKLAWLLFRWMIGLDVDDLTSGFRAYGRSAFHLLASKQATLLEYQDIGVLLLLLGEHLRIREVQVRMAPREAGYSRIFSSWFKVMEYMFLNAILCSSHFLRGHLKKIARREQRA